jgi:hypothetical protein
MAHKQSFGLPLAILLLSGLGVSSPVAAVAQAQASRLAGDWRVSEAVTIAANRPPAAQAVAVLGAAPAGARLERMLLLLEPSAAQQQALTTELAALQNSSSPQYHHWLTPAAFAAAYGNSASDAAAVSAWLQSEGLQVAALPAGRGWIEFSGTVAQVEQAFGTHIETVATSDGSRFVLASGVSVPAAIKPLVHGLVSLDGAVSTPALVSPRPVITSAAELAAQNSLSHAEALTPQLAAQLLHLDALHTAGAKGAGESIAIAARSNVLTSDVAVFRSTFGLAVSPLTVVPNGPDPGTSAALAGDQAEATLAASWAGAAAPSAQIVLVPAATTAATDGLDLSLAAIVDQALAHTVAVGYSACEAALSEAHQAFYSALYRQAAAEGIAVIAAAGDSGPSACHAAGSEERVSSGYGVNALASTPWNTAVGVAAFDASGPAAESSALAAWSPANTSDPAYASGGGSSTLYAAPKWQPLPAQSLEGIGATTAHYRLLPDLVLPSAIDTGVNPGLAFCLSASAASSGCTLVRSGGSSAATALFAGIAALVAEKNGAQGNLAPNLYALSRIKGIFDDVQQGSAKLWCEAGSPGCGSTGQIGFSAAAGYDLATGLGAVNAQALVNEWNDAVPTGTGAVTVTLAVSPTEPNSTYNPTASITLKASVVSGTSGPTPTNTVTFYDTSTGQALSTSPSALDSSGNASLTVAGVFASGGNNVEAIYNGDSNYESITSAPVSINIQPSTTSLAVASVNTAVPGQTIAVTVTLTVGAPPEGMVPPSGTVTLDLDGVATLSSPLATASGVTTASFSLVVPANSTLLTHALQAVYGGDANYSGSTSPSVSISVSKGATVTTLVANPTVLSVGTTETFTATLAPASSNTTNYTITGTVSFYDGTALLGTATISSNVATLSGIALSAATSHAITAVYSGDPSWAASTSNVVTLAAVLLGDTVTLTATPSTAAPGQVVTMIATVTPAAIPAATSEQNPSGNVIFYNGTTIVGTVALVPSINYTSTATLVIGTLTAGQDVITAYYVGDLYFKSGTSNSLSIDVEDFTITPSSTNPPENLNIVLGSAGTASFVVTGLGGFNNEIQVVCAVPSQDDMTCTATPQQILPTGTVAFVVQTFTTGGPSSTTTANNRRQPLWPGAAGGAALAVLGFFLLPFGKRTRIFAGRSTRRFWILLLLLVGLGATGIGCNSVNMVSSQGTPLGVATLKITASAYVDNTVVSHSVYLTVDVLAKGTTAP